MVSGRLIDIENPAPDDFDINDIAWALSRITRFSGHTITEIPYTVGQHCGFVCSMIYDDVQAQPNSRELALFGLLHDAAESLIGDIPSPCKKIPALHKVIAPLEDNILNIVYMKFVGRLPTNEEYDIVKFYDKKAQFIEAYNFMSSRGLQWPNREQYDIGLVELQRSPVPMSAIGTYHGFLKMFEWHYSELKKKNLTESTT